MVNSLNVKPELQVNNTNNIVTISANNYKGITISFTDLLYLNNKLTAPLKSNKTKAKKTKSNFTMSIDEKNLFVTKDTEGNEFYTNNTDFQVSKDGYLKTIDDNIVQGVKSIKSSIYSTNGDLKFDNDYIEIVDSKIIRNDETNISTINAKITEYIVSEDLDSKKGNGYKNTYVKQTNINNLIETYKDALEEYSLNPIEGSSSLKKVIAINTKDFDNANTIDIVLNDTKIAFTLKEKETTISDLSDCLSTIIGINSYIENNNLIIESVIPGVDFNLSNAKKDGIDLEIKVLQENIKGDGLQSLNDIRNSLADAIKDEAGEFLEIRNEISIDENTNIENLILNLEKLEISSSTYDKIEIEDGIIYLVEDENRFVAGQIITAEIDSNLIETTDNVYQKTDDNFIPTYSIFGLHGKYNYENNDKSFLQTIKKRTLTKNKIQYGYIKDILSSNDYINLNIELRA